MTDQHQTTPRDDEWAIALNTIKDVAFMARNLRPRSSRALNYIEQFANERLSRLGGEPSTTKTRMNLLDDPLLARGPDPLSRRRRRVGQQDEI